MITVRVQVPEHMMKQVVKKRFVRDGKSYLDLLKALLKAEYGHEPRSICGIPPTACFVLSTREEADRLRQRARV